MLSRPGGHLEDRAPSQPTPPGDQLYKGGYVRPKTTAALISYICRPHCIYTPGPRFRTPSRLSIASQQNGGGRPAKQLLPASGTATAGRQNGSGRSAVRLRPDCRTATAGKQVGGRHPTEGRRLHQRVGSSALYGARYWPTAVGPRRPQASGNCHHPPPSFASQRPYLRKAASSGGHCDFISPRLLGHYKRQGRLKRPLGLTERPLSAADRDAL